MAYGGEHIAAGPTLAGCRVDRDGAAATLTLVFNHSLLRGESVGFNASNTVAKEDTALYVLVNDSVDMLDPAYVASIVGNHHDNPWPGPVWGKYRGPYADGNEMGVTGWVAVAAKAGAAPNTLEVDLATLPAGARVAAVRYGVGSGGYNSTTGDYLVRSLGSSRVCCGPHVDPALEPCAPESCPIKATGDGALPAVPFFAAITKAGVCSCFSPQVCDLPAAAPAPTR